MTSQSASDLGRLILCGALGIVFLAHGYNHVFGGGKIQSTARWFQALGMRPGILHAWTARLTELGRRPPSRRVPHAFADAGLAGAMAVAWVRNHLTPGTKGGAGSRHGQLLAVAASPGDRQESNPWPIASRVRRNRFR